MNERIRELAEQAKGFVDLNQHIGGTNGCMVYTYDGLEKFAELIVQKCAAEAALIGISNYDNDDIAWASATISDNIKTRFGVEE